MKKYLIGSLIILIFSFYSYSQTQNPLLEGNQQFALDAYRMAIQENPTSNFCFSPYSILQAMAMVYAGAENQTQQQMGRVLHFSDQIKTNNQRFEHLNATLDSLTDSVTFKPANMLWAQKGYHFLPEYFKSIQTHFNAPLEYANFEKKRGRNLTVQVINNWVYDQSEKQIVNIIAPNALSSNTRLILVNTLYFWGAWQKEFNPDKTGISTFYGLKSKSEQPFMHLESQLAYYDDDLIQAVTIPYKGNRQSLLVVLPQKNEGLPHVEKTFDSFYLSNILTDSQKVNVQLTLPKFEIDTKTEFASTLKKMGMSLAFNDSADFSGITGQTDLKIDKVFHAAKITVAEKGTRAASGTAAIMIRKSATVLVQPFVADHPFLFILIDNQTQTILFMGRYTGE